jgi:uncharacterized protein
MVKILLFLVVVFALLFVLRLYNASKQAPPRSRPDDQPPVHGNEPMVRCVKCGVYLPRSESLLIGGQLYCRDPGCRPKS